MAKKKFQAMVPAPRRSHTVSQNSAMSAPLRPWLSLAARSAPVRPFAGSTAKIRSFSPRAPCPSNIDSSGERRCPRTASHPLHFVRLRDEGAQETPGELAIFTIGRLRAAVRQKKTRNIIRLLPNYRVPIVGPVVDIHSQVHDF